jgi:hypothetical protein
LASLAGRELKFFFTSPLFISLELVPVMLIAILNFAGALNDVVPDNLLPIVWLMIVFYSTYFELELWRKGFLNKGVKLKVYTSGSSYAPFLGHFAASLILLELKTVIFILSYLMSLQIWNLVMFLVVTHVNWLFSLSIGSIFSKEVFPKLADSTAVFLCILIFNAVTVLIVNLQVSSQVPPVFSLAQYWPTPSLEENKEIGSLLNPSFLAVSFFVLMLFIITVYLNSMVVKGLRMDGS